MSLIAINGENGSMAWFELATALPGDKLLVGDVIHAAMIIITVIIRRRRRCIRQKSTSAVQLCKLGDADWRNI